MSIWYCATHGMTGPGACCSEASLATVGVPLEDAGKPDPIATWEASKRDWPTNKLGMLAVAGDALRDAYREARQELTNRLRWEGEHPDHAEVAAMRLEAERDEARREAERERDEMEQLQRDAGATLTLRERLPWETP